MASTSGLIQNSDFSSDLLLNKVMNGQYSATSGKTITLAGRLNAAKLDNAANKLGIEAGNVREGAVYADAVANAVSEVADIAKRASNINSSMSGDALKSAAQGLYDELTGLLGLKVDVDNTSTAIFGNTLKYNLGQGSGDFTIGQATTGAISSLQDQLKTMTGGSTSSTIDDIYGQMLGEVTNAASKAALFENRYTSMNDLLTSYRNASDDQVVNAGGNSTSLLNNLIG